MIDDYNYTLLKKITDSFEHISRESLENIHVWACQHILEPQKKMFMLISEFGIPAQNIHIIGKIYSTNFEVLEELQKFGFEAIQPEFDLNHPFDEQHKANCQRMFDAFLRTSKAGDRAIVLDDGAELLNIFNINKKKINKEVNIIGIEQTSSGFRKLEKESLKFPVINVARSIIKLDKESPLIARLGCDRINDVISKYSIVEPRILIVGLGPIGNNVLLTLKEEGYLVFGHDTIFDSETEIVSLILKNNINILIGATGNNILSEQQLLELKSHITDRIYLISMSSSDREFSASFIRKKGSVDNNIHSDTIWKNLVLVNNGFPITFKGKRYESTPLEIEKTIALLFGSVLYAVNFNFGESEFVDVPKKITDIIQLYESD